MKKIILTLIIIYGFFVGSAAFSYSIRPPVNNGRFLFSFAGNWFMPDELKSAFSQVFITTIQNQKIKNNLGFSSSLAVNLKNGLYLEADYTRLSPRYSFIANRRIRNTQVIENFEYKQYTNLNIFDLNLGKDFYLNKSVSFNSYIGLSGTKSNVEILRTTPNLSLSKENIKLLGLGPNFGLKSQYNLYKRISLVGGLDVRIFATKIKVYSASGEGSYSLSSESRKPVMLPMLSAFFGESIKISRNSSVEFGIKSLHVFDFSMNGYSLLYGFDTITGQLGGTSLY